MTNRFLISVAAAALIASTGLANAQGMNREGGGGAAGGSTMQQGGGASERGAPSAAPTNRDSGASGGMKGAQSDKPEGGKAAQSDRMEGTKGKSAQDDMKGQKSQQNTADTDRKGGKDMKAEGREGKDKSTVGQSRDQDRMGREDRMGKDSDRTKTQQSQDRDRMQGQDRDRAQGQQDRDRTNAQGQSQTTTTTGQAGAGAKISTEQRTQITNVIRQQNVAPVTNVNFSVSVGTRVPRDVRFHVLPQEVVTIYPQWRGFKFIRVKEEIVIVDPNTYEIVEIIRV
jgi:hypothetical protein